MHVAQAFAIVGGHLKALKSTLSATKQLCAVRPPVYSCGLWPGLEL